MPMEERSPAGGNGSRWWCQSPGRCGASCGGARRTAGRGTWHAEVNDQVEKITPKAIFIQSGPSMEFRKPIFFSSASRATPVARTGRSGGGIECRWHQAEVGEPPSPLGGQKGAAGSQNFPQGHQEENSRKNPRG